MARREFEAARGGLHSVCVHLLSCSADRSSDERPQQHQEPPKIAAARTHTYCTERGPISCPES